MGILVFGFSLYMRRYSAVTDERLLTSLPDAYRLKKQCFSHREFLKSIVLLFHIYETALSSRKNDFEVLAD